MGRTRYEADDGSVQRARELRRNATPAELALWSVLRNRALEGHKFRKQQRLGPYYADFACHELRLIIEIDGDAHAESEAYDQRRTAFLQDIGYGVIRFSNHDVLTNLDGVAHAIREAVALNPHPPTASRRDDWVNSALRCSGHAGGMTGPIIPSPPRGRGV